MGAEHEQRQSGAVITAVNGKILRRAAQQLRAPFHVAGRILDADDVGNLRQPQCRVVLHVGNGPARHVVQDLWQIHRFGDGAEMAVQPFLGRLVVVRYDRKTHARSRLFGVIGQLDRLARGICAGAGYDRHAPSRLFDGSADQQAMFFEIHGGRLAGRADDDDAVGAFADMEIDQRAQSLQIQTAVLGHGGNDGDEAALEHGGFPSTRKPDFNRFLPQQARHTLREGRQAQMRWTQAGFGATISTCS